MIKRIGTAFLLTLFLGAFNIANAGAVPLCKNIFSASQPTRGTNLSPSQWLINLKLKIISSKALKNFDDQKYQNAFDKFSREKDRGEMDSLPTNLEEYVALLDVSMTELNLSITQMPPVVRHKIYKIINKILATEGQSSTFAAQDISSLIARGAYQKPTSFRFLLTHYPNETSAEMFTQEIHQLVITQVVIEALRTRPEARTSAFLPKWARDHKEILGLAFFTALDVANSFASGHFVAVLNPLNVLRMKANKEKIQDSLAQNGLEATMIQLQPEFETKNQINYYYAVAEKSLNWYFIGYILSPFFFN